ncbi:MAG: hypothetical protein JW983_00015, partial [Elusimicrobia bacterium]|nr:hypothetical protein [Elusimicrobiota bacterium]
MKNRIKAIINKSRPFLKDINSVTLYRTWVKRGLDIILKKFGMIIYHGRPVRVGFSLSDGTPFMTRAVEGQNPLNEKVCIKEGCFKYKEQNKNENSLIKRTGGTVMLSEIKSACGGFNKLFIKTTEIGGIIMLKKLLINHVLARLTSVGQGRLNRPTARRLYRGVLCLFSYGFLSIFLSSYLAICLYGAEDIKAKLNSNDGSSTFAIQDSDGATVGSVNSDGYMILESSITIKGDGIVLNYGTPYINRGQTGDQLRVAGGTSSEDGACIELYGEDNSSSGTAKIIYGGTNDTNNMGTFQCLYRDAGGWNTKLNLDYSGALRISSNVYVGDSSNEYLGLANEDLALVSMHSGWMRFIVDGGSFHWFVDGIANSSDEAMQLDVNKRLLMGNQDNRYMWDSNYATEFSSNVRVIGTIISSESVKYVPHTDAPAAEEGVLYYDSDDGHLKLYDVSDGWVQIGTGPVVAAAAGADDLGNHTATQDLNMAKFNIVNISSVTIGPASAEGMLHVVSDDTIPYTFSSSNTVAGYSMVISTSGRVGVGATNLNGLMHIRASNDQLILEDSAGSSNAKKWVVKANNDIFSIMTSDDEFGSWAEIMQVGRSGVNVSSITFPYGNVGIGTSEPATKFDVTGGSMCFGNAARAIEDDSANSAIKFSSHVIVMGNLSVNNQFLHDASVIDRTIDTSNLRLYGGSSNENGGGIELYGINEEGDEGRARILIPKGGVGFDIMHSLPWTSILTVDTTGNMVLLQGNMTSKGINTSTAVFTPASAPESAEGMVYYDSTDKQLKLYDDSGSWVQIGTGPVVAAAAGADDLGNHTATQNLDMDDNSIIKIGSATVTGEGGLEVTYGISGATASFTGDVKASSVTVKGGKVYFNDDTEQYIGLYYDAGGSDLAFVDTGSNYMRFTTDNSEFHWFADGETMNDSEMALSSDGNLYIDSSFHPGGQSVHFIGYDSANSAINVSTNILIPIDGDLRGLGDIRIRIDLDNASDEALKVLEGAGNEIFRVAETGKVYPGSDAGINTDRYLWDSSYATEFSSNVRVIGTIISSESVKYVPRTDAPAAEEGVLYYNSDDGQLKLYDVSDGWVQIGTGPVTTSGDNLGSHTATRDLDMNTFNIVNISSAVIQSSATVQGTGGL